MMRGGCWLTLLSLISAPAVSQEPVGQGDRGSDVVVPQALMWSELPELPDALGVAGPFAGVHHDALIVAGGANFPKPVWDHDKVWRDDIYVLRKEGSQFVWSHGGKIPRPTAYGAAVSTADGILCIGGNDSQRTFDHVFRMRYDPRSGKVRIDEFPALPSPCAFSAAAIVGKVIYVAGGQRGATLDTAMNNFWSLDLSADDDPSKVQWQKLEAWPGPTRALNLTVAQHDGENHAIYVISGRRQQGNRVEFLKDVWQFTPATRSWRRRTDAPTCVMAGVGIGTGRRHLLVLGGADGTLFHRTDELRDQHPGFPKKSWAYDTASDTWVTAGPTPANHVTTIAVKWNSAIVIPSGEVRPRVRSPKVWRIQADGWD